MGGPLAQMQVLFALFQARNFSLVEWLVGQAVAAGMGYKQGVQCSFPILITEQTPLSLGMECQGVQFGASKRISCSSLEEADLASFRGAPLTTEGAFFLLVELN